MSDTTPQPADQQHKTPAPASGARGTEQRRHPVAGGLLLQRALM
ncbi:MAG TPA: hypothetical protein VHB98_12755 [Chloroflexota bacterium]|nr:hypothetical protein [Chloroflexota bacterium]